MSRTITLKSAAMPTLLGEPALIISELEGGEALSEIYSYTVTVKTPDNRNISWQSASNIDIKSMIGKQVTIDIALSDWRPVAAVTGETREITGIVQQVRYLGRDGHRAVYQLIVRPWLYLAELTTDFRIFQNKSVITIIDEVLSEYDFPQEKRIATTYPPLDYQVQYGESDFDFVQRLMEEWGLYWFFEHKDQQHKLVIVDNIGAHKQLFDAGIHTLLYDQDAPKKMRNISQSSITSRQ